MSEIQIAAALNRLHSTVVDVKQAQVVLDQQQNLMQQAINVVRSTQDQAHAELRNLHQQFNDYLRRDELRHNLQVAETRIIQVQNELETKFGHHDQVRRLATGALQALDVGITSQGTIRQLSEELMLLTPQYWLAPALVAIAAWIRDDRDLAEKALAEACRRDNDKAALFFALVLRRHRRNAATARWLRQYIARQNPTGLSREFVVILDAVSAGGFGPESRTIVMSQLDEWYQKLSTDQNTVDRQVARWATLLNQLRRNVDGRYTVLPNISPTWPQLKELYEGATVHGAAEGMLRALMTGPLPPQDDLRVRVDGILTNLVSEFDQEEMPLRHREHELREIVKAEGDHDIAKAAMVAADPLHQATVDFLTLISNAAVDTRHSGASPGTQRLAVALAREWIEQGAGRLEAANAAAQPTSVHLVLEGWQGVIDDRSTEEGLVAGLAAHIDTDTEAAVQKVQLTGWGLATASIGGLLLILALITGLQGDPGFAATLLLVTAICAGVAIYQGCQLPRRRAALRAQGEARRTVALAQLRGGIAELVDLRAEWERERAKAANLRAFLGQLNGAAFAGRAAGETRGV